MEELGTSSDEALRHDIMLSRMYPTRDDVLACKVIIVRE